MSKTPRPNIGPRHEPASNFALLKPYETQLWRLGALAERYFAEDPNTSLLKIRQLAELLAQVLAARAGLYRVPTSTGQSETQFEQQQSAAALQAVQLQLSVVDEERAFWEQMASAAEQAKTKLAKKARKR